MRKIIIFLWLAVVVVQVEAVGVAEEAHAETVSIPVATLRGPSGVVFLPMITEKPVPIDGASISIEVVAAPDVMVARLVSGEAVVGVLPTNVAAQLYNRDIPVQVAGVFLWGVLYIVSDEEITDWRDLYGKTVYSLSAGSTPDVLFRLILEEKGLNPETDLTIDYRFGQVELAQMLLGGRITTAVLPEPFATRVVTARNDLGIALDFQSAYEDLEGSSYPQTALVIRRDFFAGKPELLQEVLKTIRKSIDEVAENPGAAVMLPGMAEIGLPAETVLEAFPRLNVKYIPISAVQNDVERYLSVLWNSDPRGVGGVLPDQGFYTP